jgi:hypothetical protein
MKTLANAARLARSAREGHAGQKPQLLSYQRAQEKLMQLGQETVRFLF